MEISELSQPGEWVLTLPGDVKISVPRGKSFFSTYVLLERGDWFEQEIRFLRNVIGTGMRIIDVGANYGMYALSMAKLVGDQGHIWAFEPASNTVRNLNRSIRLNQFQNITVLQQGLSNRQGAATFYISGRAEMNTLNTENESGATETISLTTLDQCMEQLQWNEIDFIKLDAEGEESRIIDAGGQVLSKMSPLVMFELKHVKQVNLPLISRFAEHGYQTYWLMPGPQLLVPFDPDTPFDPYLLNLFCCKEDRAEKLAESEFLIKQCEQITTKVEGRAQAYIHSLTFSNAIGIGDSGRFDQAEDYNQMLNYYVASCDPGLSPAQRVACLTQSLKLSNSITQRAADGASCSLEQIASHVRIAQEAGARNRGVQLARNFLDSDRASSGNPISTPFLPAGRRYDRIDPGSRLREWLLSSIIEQWVVDHSVSSYFTARKVLPEMQRLARLGFMDASMKRRYNLVSSLKFKQ